MSPIYTATLGLNKQTNTHFYQQQNACSHWTLFITFYESVIISKWRALWSGSVVVLASFALIAGLNPQNYITLGIMAHACDTSTEEAEARWSEVRSHPELCKEDIARRRRGNCNQGGTHEARFLFLPWGTVTIIYLMIHQAAYVLRTWHVQWQTHLLCLCLSLWSRANRVPLEHTERIAFS